MNTTIGITVQRSSSEPSRPAQESQQLEDLSHLGQISSSQADSPRSPDIQALHSPTVTSLNFNDIGQDDTPQNTESVISTTNPQSLRDQRMLAETLDCFNETLESWKIAPGLITKAQWTRSTDDIKVLNQFIERLHDTAEGKGLFTRRVLSNRLQDMLTYINNNQADADSIIDAFEESMISCEDRTIMVLEDIDRMVSIEKALKSTNPKKELRSLAKGLLALEAVDRVATSISQRRRKSDAIETYLYLHLKLRGPLKLPIKTQKMKYSNHARVGVLDIYKAWKEGKNARQDTTRLEAFLKTWDPWVKISRQEALNQLDHQQHYKVGPCNFNLDAQTTCSISGNSLAEIKTPVVLRHGESNELYDFGSLSKDWLNRGKHLVTGAPIELNDYVAAMTFIKPL